MHELLHTMEEVQQRPLRHAIFEKVACVRCVLAFPETFGDADVMAACKLVEANPNVYERPEVLAARKLAGAKWPRLTRPFSERDARLLAWAAYAINVTVFVAWFIFDGDSLRPFVVRWLGLVGWATTLIIFLALAASAITGYAEIMLHAWLRKAKQHPR